jgi:hypothetical protein
MPLNQGLEPVFFSSRSFLCRPRQLAKLSVVCSFLRQQADFSFVKYRSAHSICLCHKKKFFRSLGTASLACTFPNPSGPALQTSFFYGQGVAPTSSRQGCRRAQQSAPYECCRLSSQHLLGLSPRFRDSGSPPVAESMIRCGRVQCRYRYWTPPLHCVS